MSEFKYTPRNAHEFQGKASKDVAQTITPRERLRARLKTGVGSVVIELFLQAAVPAVVTTVSIASLRDKIKKIHRVLSGTTREVI